MRSSNRSSPSYLALPKEYIATSSKSGVRFVIQDEQERFRHLFENDVAHALSIAGERVEVTNLRDVDNLVEVTFRLYVLSDGDAAGTALMSLAAPTCEREHISPFWMWRSLSSGISAHSYFDERFEVM